MQKEMIHRFFLLQTQGTSTRTNKISCFKLILRRNIAFRSRPRKKKALVGTLGFQIALAASSRHLIASTGVEQKLLTEKEPLGSRGQTMTSLRIQMRFWFQYGKITLMLKLCSISQQKRDFPNSKTFPIRPFRRGSATFWTHVHHEWTIIKNWI